MLCVCDSQEGLSHDYVQMMLGINTIRGITKYVLDEYCKKHIYINTDNIDCRYVINDVFKTAKRCKDHHCILCFIPLVESFKHNARVDIGQDL